MSKNYPSKEYYKNLDFYKRELEVRTNPIASILEPIKARIKNKKQRGLNTDNSSPLISILLTYLLTIFSIYFILLPL